MSRLISSALLAATVLSCAGAQGPEGPQGPPGPPGPQGMPGGNAPSVSAVTPAAVVQGNEYDVTLAGFATLWSDQTTVSFGPGITVTRLKAASPTSLVVHVKVESGATPDTRDVQVTQDAQTLFWRNAFTVLPRWKLSALGTASQLSMSVVRLEVNEPQFEFDTSSDLFGGFNGVNVVVSPPLRTQVLSVASKVVDVLVQTDVDATVEAYDVTVVSRAGTLQERRFSATQLVTVTPRASMDLVDGVPANGSIDAPFQSKAYRWESMSGLDAGALGPIVLNVGTNAAGATPRLALVPMSGRFEDLITFASTVAVTPAQGALYWVVVWESSGASGFQYTLTATPARRQAEEEPNDGAAMARALPALPAVLGLAQLPSLTDQDWVKVTAGPGDVGKRLHVITQPGDDATDTVVEVFKSDGVTSLGGASDDSLHEDFFTPPLPAQGDYFVKVSMSSTVVTWDAAQSHYDLLLTVE
ncbi:MAG: hypothetical protein IPJ65_12115 [Archangiaceae bacterium]|nr:hypothetical protein [Archangiaceae bacterium]